jgi:aryl-alcohol dehydrogenase-like predicted oxidoreductase
MKLGLGTVQFGTDYGVSNRLGQTGPDEVEKILKFAAANRINYLDTAPAYGNSEAVLGAKLTPSHQFRIVTKTIKIGKSTITDDDVKLTLDAFTQSLRQLQQDSVYGLLIHHPDDLLNAGGDRLMSELKALKTKGLVNKVGVSVYDREEIDRLLDKYSLDLIQVPLNVFDRRLLKNDYLRSIKNQGIEIHVRSVFLQGILLMSAEQLPSHLSGFSSYLKQWRKILNLYSISPLAAALNFVSNLTEVDAIMIGVNSLVQLKEIVSISLQEVIPQDDIIGLSIEDSNLIDPSLWHR